MLQTAQPAQSDIGDPLVTRSITPVEQPRQRLIFATLQINPLDSYSDNPEHQDLSHRLAHLIAERAPEFDGIPVIDPDGPMAAEQAPDHLYALMGTILQEAANPDRIEISLRLVHRPSYEIVWTKTYSSITGLSLLDPKLIDIRNDIVQSISGPNGAIRVDDARRHIEEKTSSTSAQICLAESDMALRMRDGDMIAKSIACLSALTAKRSDEPLLFKQLAALKLVHVTQGRERAAAVTEAIANLETAIRLNPDDHAARDTILQLQSAAISAPDAEIRNNHLN